MNKVYYILYIFLAIAIGLVYGPLRPIIIDTQPGLITISNLTVNYVAMSFITGGFSGWYLYNRLLVKQMIVIRLGGTAVAVFMVAILWLSVMSLGGYHVRHF